jgi:hypothetical protein
MTDFVYPPLPPDRLRLLILHPGKPSDEISCSLMTDLWSCVSEFEAVSYVWGSSERPYKIKCNVATRVSRPHILFPKAKPDKDMSVTASLKRLLERLRGEEGYRILWIDAICINQNSNEEKSSQVAVMHRIYRQASEVLVYIGEADQDTASALAYASLTYPRTRIYRQRN